MEEPRDAWFTSLRWFTWLSILFEDSIALWSKPGLEMELGWKITSGRFIESETGGRTFYRLIFTPFSGLFAAIQEVLKF